MNEKFWIFIDFILSLITNICTYCAVVFLAAEIKCIYLQDNEYRIFWSALVEFIELTVLYDIGKKYTAGYIKFQFISNEKLNKLLSSGISLAAIIAAGGLAFIMANAWIK